MLSSKILSLVEIFKGKWVYCKYFAQVFCMQVPVTPQSPPPTLPQSNPCVRIERQLCRSFIIPLHSPFLFFIFYQGVFPQSYFYVTATLNANFPLTNILLRWKFALQWLILQIKSPLKDIFEEIIHCDSLVFSCCVWCFKFLCINMDTFVIFFIYVVTSYFSK